MSTTVQSSIEPLIAKLLQILTRLRGPEGCPWDRAQTLESMRSCLLEETWEVLDTIERKDLEHLQEELGDVLLNVFLLSDIADAKDRAPEHGPRFDGAHFLGQVLSGLCQKLVSRHAHVFGDRSAANADEALDRWQEVKRTEKEETNSVLDSVSRGQAALLYALKLQKKAAKLGFDWPCETASQQIGEKVKEELEEFYEAVETDSVLQEEELGDILFSVVNLARAHSINPELALMRSSEKFRRRFQQVEKYSAGRPLKEMDLDQLWEQAKAESS